MRAWLKFRRQVSIPLKTHLRLPVRTAMLHPLVLWRLANETGGLATCRFVPAAGCYELHLSVGEETHREQWDNLSELLLRAADLETILLEQGWQECVTADTHDAASGDTFQPHPALREERRGAPRAQPGPLRVRVPRGGDGILVNVSESGALMQVSTPQQVDTDIDVSLDWDGVSVYLKGRVVRCSSIAQRDVAVPLYYLAVRFGELAPEATAALTVLVRVE